MRPHSYFVRPLFALVLLFFFSVSLFAQSNEEAKTVLNNYLAKNADKLKVDNRDFAELHITSNYIDASTGIQHIYAQQRFNGIDVVGGSFGLHSSIKGNKQFDANNLFTSKTLSVPGSAAAISAEQAARKGLAVASHPENLSLQVKETTGNTVIFKRSDYNAWDIPVRKVYLPNEKHRKFQLAWEVQMFDAVGRHYWVMYFDAATGNLLNKKDAIIHCRVDNPNYHFDEMVHLPATLDEKIADYNRSKSDNTIYKSPFAIANVYKVFPEPIEAPHDGSQVDHSTAGNANASPDGWHRIANGPPQPNTWGNNVMAFYDPSPGPLGGAPNQATSAPATLTTPVTIEPMEFKYPFDPATEPDAPGVPPAYTNRMAAIVNLFYWNNLLHDVFYQFGFNEQMNFQASHVFSTGPKTPADGSGDPVWAQAQDGGGTNNANMLTLADGAPGSAQMQMYLWTTASPAELVQIATSTVNPPANGQKYIAIQGSFAQPTGANNLHTNPTPVTQFVIPMKHPLSQVGDSSQGCSTGQQSIALPTPGVSGRIAVIDRGGCSFVEKVYGAQLGGAVGVIIVNNIPGPPIAMGGTDAPGNSITIPAVMVSMADGAVIKNAIRNGIVTGQLKRDNPPEPKRDGDFDNAVIAHEYGHGISNRMTGNGDILLPLGGDEQGGEGWSDFIGLYMITRADDLLAADATHPNGILPEKGIGTYVVYQPKTGQGIRPTKYSVTATPAYTFDDIDNPEITIPHGVGYIWCQMLYSMEQELINIYGFNDDIYNAATPSSPPATPPFSAKGNNIAMKLVMEGMRMQPQSPTFQQQRDAILAADTALYGGIHSCVIWKAFAKFGLGFSAQSNSNGVGDEVEAFDLPGACDATQVNIAIDLKSPPRVINGATTTDTIRVKNIFSNVLNNLLVVDTLSQYIVAPYTTNPPGATHTVVGGKNVITWLSSLGANETKTFTVTGSVATPTAGTQLFYDNHEDGAGGWTTSSTNPTANWTVQSTKPYSGTKHWFVPNIDPNLPSSDQYLQMANDVTIPAGGAELVFFHFYNAESGFDGGSVEISNNGGASWTYVPNNLFVRNGYNGIIPVANNPGYTHEFAFTGTSAGYITSIVNLASYQGQNVRIRFRFTQDVGTKLEGWYVDDVYFMTNRTEITNVAVARVGSDASFSTILDQDIDSATSFVFLAGTPLPVTAQLKARGDNSSIKLEWTTQMEQNVRGFEIERMAQNEQSFTTIGFVQAAGNTTTNRAYSHPDQNVQKNMLYSYRLKMIDNDGRFKYSNIATARLDGIVKFGFMLHPNPASDKVTLKFNLQPGTKATLKVYDVSGKHLSTFNMAAVQGLTHDLNVSGFKAGVYWLELNDNGFTQNQKLIIQR